jgi:hypothetical protein
MRSLTIAIATGLASIASAQPTTSPMGTGAPAVPPTAAKAAEMPGVGDPLPLVPDFWPKQKWLYDAPSANDAAGKVVIHWFCTAKVQACTDDLARIINLRDNGRVYIIAYLDGYPSLAKKLDPIRESEGVGKGTVATGPGVTKLMKLLNVKPGPTSIVVGVEGKVTMVSVNGDANALDARDAEVNKETGAIKEFTTSHDGPATVKANDKFALTFKVVLASWLSYSQKTPTEFSISVPKDIKCDATTLKGDQLKVDGKTLTATVNCSAPHGVYQAVGKIRFGYASPTGASGLGDDGATWNINVN